MKTKLVSIFAVTLLLVVAAADFACAQQQPLGYRPVIKYPPNTRPGAGGVRGLSEVPTTDLEIGEPAATRGAACCLEFENKTGFFVDIWLDKEYRGRISPWQQGYSLCNVGDFKTFTAQTIGKKQDWSGDIKCENAVVLMAK